MGIVAHATILEIMESRFDYYSARAVLSDVLERAQLRKGDGYDADQLVSFARTLAATEKRVDGVVDRLLQAAGKDPQSERASWMDCWNGRRRKHRLADCMNTHSAHVVCC